MIHFKGVGITPPLCSSELPLQIHLKAFEAGKLRIDTDEKHYVQIDENGNTMEVVPHKNQQAKTTSTRRPATKQSGPPQRGRGPVEEESSELNSWERC